MTTPEAKSVIEDAGLDWDKFVEWMQGQTVGMYEDGSTNWYVYDVQRYVNGNTQLHSQ